MFSTRSPYLGYKVGMSDLRPATRDEILSHISYALRFDRRGKATRRHSELMAQLAAETLADMLDQAGFVLMKKPSLIGAAATLGQQTGSGDQPNPTK